MRRSLTLFWIIASCRPESGKVPPAPPSLPAHRITETIRTRVEEAGVPARLEVEGDSLYATGALPSFYERREYRPVWSDSTGPLPIAAELVLALRAAGREGLRPSDYHIEGIQDLLDRIRTAPTAAHPDARVLADLDLLLTDAYLVYGSHLVSGRVDPETFDPEWQANRRGADMVAVLEGALADGRIASSLQGLLPPQKGYWRLREALERYRLIASQGGWPTVPAGPVSRLGSREPRIELLRRRLGMVGDLDSVSTAEPQLFDEGVESALRRFQERHGLEPTVALDAPTLAALDVPASERVRQIVLNLERWRWLPQDLGYRHVLVNIAASDLRVEEGEQAVFTMRVIVGQPYRRTPVFSDTMRYIVLSPYWNVPRNIAVQDKLPLIRRDPGYLAKQNIKVFDGWGADATEVDPTTVDWGRVTPANFHYHLRQDPGPQNALGAVKFMFPNKYNVYLHDTPTRDLFARADRNFSSGCIRLERPIDLAVYLLGDEGWTREQILAAVRARAERTVPLRQPIPVHLLFWTAWADEQGQMEFRRDPYGRDQRLQAALATPAPSD
jgi:L,D-transpeptidase YcbB